MHIQALVEAISLYVTVLYYDFPIVVVVVVVRVSGEQADGAEADEGTHDVPLPQPGRRRQGMYE